MDLERYGIREDGIGNIERILGHLKKWLSGFLVEQTKYISHRDIGRRKKKKFSSSVVDVLSNLRLSSRLTSGWRDGGWRLGLVITNHDEM